MSRTPGAHVPDSPDALRPLPAKPNLEFERKRAKQLLREVRAGDREAPNRVRSTRAGRRRGAAPTELKLAHAQFAIAREYGFTSWPMLVKYFTAWERHERTGPMFQSHPLQFYQSSARRIIAGHRARRPADAQALATFVPRFYGRPDDEIFAAELREEDARLVVARQNRFSSWEELVAHATTPPLDRPGFYGSPLMLASAAVRQHDLGALSRIVGEHSELLETPDPQKPWHSILNSALLGEQRTRSPEARKITDWLVSQGADLQAALNHMLLHCFRVSTEEVTYLLDRGADPDWMPSNGISVLEHALLRYWNPEAVDLIASRVVPRKAFWISAGLGDVRGTLRYLDRNGVPTEAARRHRPDFLAVGPAGHPYLPFAHHPDIVWEAFLIAGLNQRTAVLDALIDRGFPVDYNRWGMTLLGLSVGNGVLPTVECLLNRGANPDVPIENSNRSPRHLAHEMFLHSSPRTDAGRRIFELCWPGRDAGALERQMQATRRETSTPGLEGQDRPQPTRRVETVLAVARDVAREWGQSYINPEHLLLALLRTGGVAADAVLQNLGVDRAKLEPAYRIVPRGNETVQELAEISLVHRVQMVMDRAAEIAAELGHSYLGPEHLLLGILREKQSLAFEILDSFGVTEARATAETLRLLGT